jgi:hypothetical protein
MSSALETKVQRRLTTEFIKADPKQVTLLRKVKVPNGSGGFNWQNDPASPLPPQMMRLIPANRQLQERETSTGTKVTADMTLMAEYDANLKRFDELTDQGITYQVIWVYEKRVYEVKAEVVTLRGST